MRRESLIWALMEYKYLYYHFRDIPPEPILSLSTSVSRENLIQ